MGFAAVGPQVFCLRSQGLSDDVGVTGGLVGTGDVEHPGRGTVEALGVGTGVAGVGVLGVAVGVRHVAGSSEACVDGVGWALVFGVDAGLVGGCGAWSVSGTAWLGGCSDSLVVEVDATPCLGASGRSSGVATATPPVANTAAPHTARAGRHHPDHTERRVFMRVRMRSRPSPDGDTVSASAYSALHRRSP